MRSAVAGLLLAACVGPGDSPARSPTALPQQPSVFFAAPADREVDGLVFDVEPAPGGTTTLVVVPALATADYRAHPELATLTVPVTVTAQAIEHVERRVGRALPPPRAALAVPDPAPAAALHGPSETRAFRIWSTRSLRYVPASGHQSLLGRHYAFYDDDTNATLLRADEYAALDAILERWWPELARTFGSPTDVDGDGHVLVLMSRTAAVEQPTHRADADPCPMSGGADCGPPGEVIVSWSLEGLGVPLAIDELASTLLHETVHLAQHAAAVRAGVPLQSVVLPPWVREGQAELATFVSGVGLERLWSEARSELLQGSQLDAPFFRPYATGALPFRWAQGRFGPDAQRALLAASVDLAAVDPFATAFDVPEPLVLAETALSMRLDGTELGRETGLELPLDDVLGRLGAPLPSANVAIGGVPVTTDVRFTGHADFQIVHRQPVRLTVSTGSSIGAYALVARP